MGRNFTIDFAFRENTYPAMVTINSGAYNFSITIQVSDPVLLSLLPEGKFYYSNVDRLDSWQEIDHDKISLIECMVAAVEDFLAVKQEN